MSFLPNILSVSRVFLAIILLPVYSVKNFTCYKAAITIIFVAALTDFLDGLIARKYKVVSKQGYIWDGLGDRAIHIALILVFFVSFKVSILLVWFLIFREISIYAFRLIIPEWQSIKRARKISIFYVIGIRLWFFIYIILDGLSYFNFNFKREPILYFQNVLVLTILIIGYYGLLKYLRLSLKIGSK